MRNGKLAAWLGLVGALAALNYASRFASGKPPPDTLYRYDTAVSGVIFYAITLAILLRIARGLTRRDLGLRAPDSWGRALGFTFLTLIALLASSAFVGLAVDAGGVLIATEEAETLPEAQRRARELPPFHRPPCRRDSKLPSLRCWAR